MIVMIRVSNLLDDLDYHGIVQIVELVVKDL